MADQPDHRDPETVTAEMQEKLTKVQKAKEAMESLYLSLQKLETNLRTLQESALLLRQVLAKFQQLSPEQRARVAQALQKTLRPADSINTFFSSSTLH